MTWRERILAQFIPGVARLTLVADPDGLLTEEGILQGIRERGFELIPFEDPIAFRFAYESRYRSLWDRGELTDLVVVLRSHAADLRALPYDLLQAGRRLAFNLGDLFPNLSYPVVAALDRGDLGALYEAQAKHKPSRLGDNATRDFVLRHVFEIAPELIKQPADLLRVLLRKHYRRQRVPATIDGRLLQLLRQGDAFADWPLEAIVPDREAFFSFLQERWPLYLDAVAGGAPALRDQRVPVALEYPGPVDLPFNDDDVRVYIDNLFADGVLHPVEHKRARALAGQWVAVGLRIDPEADRQRRLHALLKSVAGATPGANAQYQAWLAFAPRWAELIALWHAAASGAADELAPLQAQVDTAFLAWTRVRYGGLHNQPLPPAVMLHHVPRIMASRLEQGPAEKVALVVVDGLALDQWVVLREALPQARARRMRESAVFAWLPTITPVSRQALFAGRPPLYFPASLHTTAKESALWSQFWRDRGMAAFEVCYLGGLGEPEDLASVQEALAHPKLRVAGLVIDKVDKIMHGMELGTAGMHNQVRQWAGQGFVGGLLDLLLERGFSVFLAADHGNIEAIGCGSPAEGAIAELRGARVRVYPDEVLRTQVQMAFPQAIAWPPLGLPDGYLPLLAPGRSAFIHKGQRAVAHGGISVEELIVPFVHIEARDK